MDWPQFQLDAQHSAFVGTSAIRAPLQPAWTATLAPGWDFSSAVVANGVVYAGSINGQLAAFSQSSGQQLWSYTTAGSIHLAPAVSAGRVVFGSADGKLVAVDASSGSLIWSLGVGSNINSSPNISNGVVYVGANDGNAYAVDATSGAVIWRQNLGNYLLASPAISGQQVVFATVDGRVMALDKGTGAVAWTATLPAEVRSSPAVSGNLIYIGAHDGVLRALNAGTGAVAWSAPYSAPIFNGVAVSTFAVYTASLDGRVTALDKNAGTPLWQFNAQAGIHAAPTLIGSALVIGCENNTLYVLDAAGGTVLYQTTLPGRVAGPAALSLGRVYVATDDGTLSAFQSPNKPPFAPLALAVDGRAGLAINTSSAAFSWTFTDPDAGDAQSEFRLQVSSASAGTFLDTGVVDSTGSAYALAGPLAEGSYNWQVQTYDLFGASSPFSTATFVVDRTPPQVKLGAPLGGERFVAIVSTINVSFVVTDNLDPAPTSQAYLVEVQHQGGPSGNLPTRVAVSSGSAIAPMGIDSGLWQMQVTATDWAGNSTSTVSGTFQVVHDVLPPRTSLVLGAPESSSGTLVYATDVTTFGLVAVDDLATVGDGIGLGVATTYLSIDGGTFTAVGSTFTLSAEGLHTARFYSVDFAGNRESVSTTTIGVDLTPPVTQLQIAGPSAALASGGIGVSSATAFSLLANDPLSNGVASGVASVLYVIDHNPFDPACQGVPLDPTQAPGTCANESYFGPFSLAPGAHTIYFLSEDAVGNQETVHVASITVDSLPPRTSLAVGSPQSDSGSGFKYVARQTVFNLTSVDDLSVVGDAIGLGVSTQTLLVDSVLRSTFGASGAVAVLSSSFTLATDTDGFHALSYFAQDAAGNSELVHVATVAVDNTPPLTQLATSGGKTFPGPDATSFYASSATSIGFVAVDPVINGVASGLAATRWQDNGGAFQTFGSSFTLGEGAHRLSYQSQDRAQNLEVLKSTTILVDATPPATTISIGAPTFTGQDGTTYVTPATPVSFAASDPALPTGQPGSGVNHTEVSIDGSPFAVYASSLTFAEGAHTVGYRSIDNVGNVEATRTLSLKSDATPPSTALAPVGGHQFGSYSSLDTRYSLTSADPVVKGVASGVAALSWQDNGGARQSYTAPFALVEGAHNLGYQSQDNVGNLEALRSTSILVDGTAPLTALSIIGGRQFPGPDASTFYASSDTRLGFIAVDPLAGIGPGQGTAPASMPTARAALGADVINGILYAVGGYNGGVLSTLEAYDPNANAWSTKSPMPTARQHLAAAAANGILYVVGGQTSDDVNSSVSTLEAYDPTTNSWTTKPGMSMPRTHLAAGVVNGVLYVVGGYRRGALGTVEAYDPGTNTWTARASLNTPRFLHTVQVLNGVLYAIGGYDASAHILGSVEAYDPVTNTWTPRSSLSTARIVAASGVVGGQIYVAGGTDGTGILASVEAYSPSASVWTPAAPLTTAVIGAAAGVVSGRLEIVGGGQGPTGPFLSSLQAVGPAAAGGSSGVASGVAFTRWQDNSGAFQNFGAPITLAEGAHQLGYQSQDNVANVEVVRSTNAWIDATPPVSSFAFGTPYYAAPDGTNYVSPTTSVTFTAADPALPGGQPGSGVSRIEVAVDGASFAPYSGALTFAEGAHTIVYRSVDNIGNVEAARTLSLKSDATPPGSTLQLSGPVASSSGTAPTGAILSAAPASGLPIACSGFGMVAYGGRDYVAGCLGTNAPSVYSAPINADGSFGTWVQEANQLPFGVEGGPGMTQYGGRLYFAGGYNYVTGGAQNAVWMAPINADGSVGVWARQTNSLPTPVNGNSIVAANGRLFSVGGSAYASGSVAAVYSAPINADGSIGAWTATTALPQPLSWYGLVASSGYLITVGGANATGPTNAVYSAVINADGTLGPWTSQAALPLALSNTRGTAVLAGRVYLAGGCGASGCIQTTYSAALGPNGAVGPWRQEAVSLPPGTGNGELVAWNNRLIALGGDPTGKAGLSLAVDVSPASGGGFVSPSTMFSLSAVDAVSNGVASGVAFTRYRVNGGAFTQGPLTFQLTGGDGAYTIDYQSQDNVGNLESLHSLSVVFDRTPPVTTAHVGGSSFVAADGTQYVTPATPVTFSAVDPSSGAAVASGVNHIEVALDGGSFSVYSATLTFAEGRHTVAYRAVDNVGNVETARTLALQSDNTPPVSTLNASGTYFAAAGNNYAPLSFSYSLSAQDPVVNGVASGVAATLYRVDSGSFTAYASSFSLTEGIRRVDFQSRDNVGNLELLKSATVFVDATPPVSTLSIGSPKFDAGNNQIYVAPATPLSLSAQDPVVNGVASGVNSISFRRGMDPFAAYSSSFTLPLPDGAKALNWYSADNVGNVEAARSGTLLLDGTAPQTSLAILGGRQFSGPGAATFYASSDTRLALMAADPIVNGVASGVAFTQYQDNGGAFIVYAGTLALNEGAHALAYQSQDRVANLEVLRSTGVWIDATPPASTFTFGAPYYQAADGTNYVTPATPLTFSASDPALPTGQPGSGVNRIEVSVDGGAFAVFTASLTFAEGRHAVSYRSVDNVGNVEPTRTLGVQSDATPPQTALALSGGKQAAASPVSFYASADTRIGFAAVDPLVNNVASGVAFTRYQDNGGAFTTFSAPFALAEGSHAIIYLSQDNVQNLEVARSTTVLVDATAPLTSLTIIGGRQFPGPSASTLYASSDTRIVLAAADPIVNGVASGVAFTQYQDNGGAFIVYAGTLALSEGAHALAYQSQDRVANLEVLRSTGIWIDATPPASTFTFGAPYYQAADGTNYVTPATPLVFSAADPALPTGQPGSGVNHIEVAVDGGGFVVYTASLTFAEGRHAVSFRSIDNVGNVEATRTLNVQSDATAPLTSLALSGGKQATAAPGAFYASADTRVGFAALDPIVNNVASGLAFTRYQDNGGAFTTFAAPFALAEGSHTITYQSQDNVQNLEVLRSTTVLVDATAPRTTVAIGAPLFIAPDGTKYVTPTTPVSFSALDPSVNGVASGVDHIEVNIDGGGFVIYSSTLTFIEGKHTVLFRAVDRVGNVETAQALALQSDNTPPVTALNPSGAYFTSGSGNYAPLSFTYSLSAQDPVVNGVASGVAATLYRVDAASFTTYASSFSLTEGARRVDFQSRDNVGNVELLKSATVFVDATPPASSLAIGTPRFDPGGGQPVFIAPSSLLTLSAVDPVVQGVASGVKAVSFRRGTDAFASYSTPFTMPVPDGVKTVDYFAVDNVGNQEVTRSTTVALDGTAPVTSLLVIGGRQSAGPNSFTFYASSDTRLALPAADPAVNGVASGLALTRWQDNGGSFQTYASTLALAEGAHALGYQSQDNVQNLEVLRSTNVWIDATPPVSTFTFGAPYYQAADGTNYVTPATSVTLSAADPALPTGQPGSGVNHIEVAVDGAAFTPYAAPLSFAEGRHSVVFRSIDNVGNTEVARVLQVQSDATPPSSSLVIGQPQYQLPNALLVSARTPIGVSSVDPVINGVASGVKDVWYAVNDVAASTGAFQPFVSSFTLSGADVGKAIQFYARDNVLNVEVVKSSTVLLDSTPPTTALLSPASRPGGVCAVVKGKVPVLGTAVDAHFAGYTLSAAPGQNASAGFATFASANVAVTSSTLGNWDTTALSGWQTLRLTASDLVANTSSVSVSVSVGDPSETLVLGSHDFFNMPQGVAAAASGGLVVADTNDDQIKVFSSTGASLAAFGDMQHAVDSDGDEGISTAPLRFNKPRAVALDAAGNYYVADTNDNRVVVFSPAGQLLWSAGKTLVKANGNGNANGNANGGGNGGNHTVYKPGSNPGEFNKPSGIAVDAAGKIYVADTLNHRVQVLSSTGAVTLVFPLPAVPAAPGSDDDDDGVALGMPHGIAVDSSGKIYVADPKGARALVFGASGQLLSQIPVAAGTPYGVAADPSGQCVAVSDRKNARVLVFDASGGLKLSFGAQGRIPDSQSPPPSIVFNKPAGLALASDGTLLVADRNNERVERFAAPTGQSLLVVPAPSLGSPDAAKDVVDKDAGGSVVRTDGAGVSVPAGALAQDLKISVSTLTANSLFQVALMNGQADKNGLSPAYAPIQFMPEGTQFASPATLTMPYNPILLAQEGISENALKIEYWNPNSGNWQPLDSTIDKINHVVSAKTAHFSTYQVLGSTGTAAVTIQSASDRAFVFSDVYAYPNPARPGQSPTIHVDAGSADQVDIHIYDLSGELKATTSLSGPQLVFEYRWNVSGIGSGVYIYVVTATKAGSGKLRRTGRLAVIK